MDTAYIIRQLAQNRTVIFDLLKDATPEEYNWRPEGKKWCLLEIVCHLVDEEKEDFRTRVGHVLDKPNTDPPTFDPVAWVTERDYMAQDYDATLETFSEERIASVGWLESLLDPQWDNAYTHRVFGSMSAKLFLSNWLAHDLLHIRQIMKTKFLYLQHVSGQDLSYAGEW